LKTHYLFPAAAVAGLLSSFAIAQTTVSYTSPIADYLPFVDEKVTSWKAANDKVGQIGGWRAYAKEAQQPDKLPAPPPNISPTTSPPEKAMSNSGEVKKVDPHAGHKQ
jgi:hypothetical protein